MQKFSLLVVLFVSCLTLTGIVGQTASAATLVHAYDFDGDFLDALGGPALVPNGGILGANRYTFGVNQGLSLTNGLVDTTDYSIVMVFEYDSLSPFWKKIIDFQQLGQDIGLYIGGDLLRFWTIAIPGGPDTITANTDVQVVLTRDGTMQTVSGYMNGVLQWTTSDFPAQAVTGSNVLTFFEDDFATGRFEAQSGSVDCIAIYDGALSAAEIAVIALQPNCGAAIDSDGDGVDDPADFCPDTVISEGVPTVRLGTNRWALVNDDFDFDTSAPKGKGPRRSYSTTDTAGCSCEQIIDAQGLGAGHRKFGCSISAMDDWVALVAP